MPLARYASNTRGRLAVTTPFSFWITVDEAKSTNVSALSEKVLVSDDKIWFTQGGGLQPARTTAEANHSRVFSIDLLAEDSPKTLFDDRICAYNVPADEPGGPVNSQVLGMAVVGERVWLAESRGILSDEYAVVSSFIADERHCGNLLNFNDDRALAEQSLQYCSEFQTAEQDGCVERLILSELPKDTKVAHLEPDPDDGTIWFSDARGRFLGHIDPAKGNAVRVFEFEDTHSDPFNGVPEFGGFPWALRVDSSAVYIGEYATRHILRFDKASKSFSEVHIPCGSSQVTLHSIDLDPVRERLWFTLSNEQRNPLDKNASTIGYVDIGSWERHIATPDRHGEIDGVIYEGLSSIPASEALPDRHQAFRGIDVNDVTGDIAIATMWRNQITVLEPLPGFWP